MLCLRRQRKVLLPAVPRTAKRKRGLMVTSRLNLLVLMQRVFARTFSHWYGKAAEVIAKSSLTKAGLHGRALQLVSMGSFSGLNSHQYVGPILLTQLYCHFSQTYLKMILASLQAFTLHDFAICRRRCRPCRLGLEGQRQGTVSLGLQTA